MAVCVSGVMKFGTDAASLAFGFVADSHRNDPSRRGAHQEVAARNAFRTLARVRFTGWCLAAGARFPPSVSSTAVTNRDTGA